MLLTSFNHTKRFVAGKYSEDDEYAEQNELNFKFDTINKSLKDIWAAASITHRKQDRFRDRADNARLLYVQYKGDLEACINDVLPITTYENLVERSKEFAEMPYLKYGVDPDEEYLKMKYAYIRNRVLLPY